MHHNEKPRLTLRAVRATAALTMLVAVVALASSASAYQTFNGHRLTYGVHNQQYWVQSVLQDAHPNSIDDGVAAWNATTDTPVYYTKTSYRPSSRLDFYRRGSSSNSFCAATGMFIDEQEVNPFSTNWWWAKVTVDPLLANTNYCGPTDHRRGIIAHEQGHAMGLAHTSDSELLMYTGIAGTDVNLPRRDDRSGIRALYN